MLNSREASLEIEKHLKKKDLARLQELSKDWKTDLYKLNPIELRLKLQQEFQKYQCNTSSDDDELDHFDDYIQLIAERNGIETIGLETDSLQLIFINREMGNPTWKSEKKNIIEWSKQLQSEKPNLYRCTLARMYRNFEVPYDFDKECKNDVLIYERNNNWMEILPELLSTKNTFICVGLNHLRFDCGLIERFQEMGLLVEPMELSLATQRNSVTE